MHLFFLAICSQCRKKLNLELLEAMPGPVTLSEVGSMKEPLSIEEPLTTQQQQPTAQQTNSDSVREFVYIPEI